MRVVLVRVPRHGLAALVHARVPGLGRAEEVDDAEVVAVTGNLMGMVRV